MRRSLFLVLGWGLSACAFGSTASTDKPAEHDAGAHDAASSNTDAGAPSGKDSGSTNNLPDAGSSTGCAAFTGALATFDFTGEPGDQSSTPAASSAKDVTAGPITRATPLAATVGTNSINSSGWATSTSADPSLYYTFSLTPSSGCALDIDSIDISTKSSSTGPAQGALATSTDKFASKTSVTSNGTATATIAVSGATGAVEVRVYGFGASAAGGTMRIQGTLTVSGALH